MSDPTTITAQIDGQVLTVELHRVTGLDALVYRQATAEPLDGRIGLLVLTAPESPDGWMLADQAVIKWLWVRQNANPDATLPEVAATVTMWPEPTPDDTPAPDGAGVVGAPAGASGG